MCGQFCTLCGRCALVAGRDAPMKIIPGRCPACGFLNGPTAHSCASCGGELLSFEGLALSERGRERLERNDYVL